jgi:hypothetical protein
MWFGLSKRNTLHPRENGVVLLKSRLARVSLSFFYPSKVAHTQAFYNSRLSSYNESQGPTGNLGAVKPLCCRTPPVRSSK